MKTNPLFLIVFLACIAITAHAQIPNPSFESWSNGDPSGWVTSNVFPAGLVPVTQTSDCHQGASALRGDVVDFFGVPTAPIIQSGPGGTGNPITERYGSFDLWYKFTSVGGDKFSVNVGFDKDGSPVAQGVVALPQTVAGYTYLTVPMAYITGDIPDNAIIQISITGPETGPDVHMGSVMFIDALTLSYPTGIRNDQEPKLVRKCYPNPTYGPIHLDLLEDTQENAMSVSLYSLQGRKVYEQTVPTEDQVINVQLPDGIYILQIQSGELQQQELVTVQND